MKKLLFYGLPRIVKTMLAMTLRLIRLPGWLVREVLIQMLKRVFGCKVYVPKGKSRMGNKQYELR